MRTEVEIKENALSCGVEIATAANGARPQRILFLGNSYNQLSVACLQALSESKNDITVGIYHPFTRGVSQFARDRLNSRGWSLVLQKAAHLIKSETRIALRRVDVPLPGFASLPEICHVRGLNVMSCTDPNSAAFVRQVRSLGIDLVVVAAFGRILKR